VISGGRNNLETLVTLCSAESVATALNAALNSATLALLWLLVKTIRAPQQSHSNATPDQREG
jgi:hypothetical protein